MVVMRSMCTYIYVHIHTCLCVCAASTYILCIWRLYIYRSGRYVYIQIVFQLYVYRHMYIQGEQEAACRCSGSQLQRKRSCAERDTSPSSRCATDPPPPNEPWSTVLKTGECLQVIGSLLRAASLDIKSFDHTPQTGGTYWALKRALLKRGLSAVRLCSALFRGRGSFRGECGHGALALMVAAASFHVGIMFGIARHDCPWSCRFHAL